VWPSWFVVAVMDLAVMVCGRHRRSPLAVSDKLITNIFHGPFFLCETDVFSASLKI